MVKNCLVKCVIEGMVFEGFGEYFIGLMVVVYFDDVVGFVKVLIDFVKE